MRQRLASILLLFCYAGLGAGALSYLHNLQHEAEDACEDASAQATGTPVHPHDHNENNCAIHASLFLAFFFDACSLAFVFLHRFLAFVLPRAPERVDYAFPLRIGCRGPPAMASSH